MTKALNKRIANAFDKIYARGDAGLDYMDGHEAMEQDLMQWFYDDDVDLMTTEEKQRLATMLETIVSDMEFDLETF